MNPIIEGYGSRSYAFSMGEFGVPRQLRESGGWVLKRRIDDSKHCDAMGLYPIFSCENWGKIADDMDALADELVSVTLVADPLGDHSPEMLASVFKDICKPFKEHLLVDFSGEWRTTLDAHHRRNIRYAQKHVTVERVAVASETLSEWIRLYDNLIARHGIKGITAFSCGHFEKLLCIPGIRAYRATENGQTIGMLLWMIGGKTAYYHLGAYDKTGYSLKASYALFDVALSDFAAEGFRWVCLGGVAGTTGVASGLSRFKEGWSNCRRMSYLCGIIFDHTTYNELVTRLQPGAMGYFPAYRAGEFR